MAIGDDAAAAGFPLVPESGEEGKVKYGAREINRTRDLIAQRTSTVQPISKGGTGATTAAAARTALGVPALAHAHSADDITHGTLAIARGGTGGASAAAARAALGASAEGHTHPWDQVTSKPGAFPPSGHNHDQLASGSSRFGIGSNGEWWTNNTVGLYGTTVMTGRVEMPALSVVTSSYRAVYQNGDGRIGVTPSARKYKKDIRPKAYGITDAAALEVVNYRLRAGLFGSTDAPVEVGVIAEQLIDVGLSEFVIFNAAGEPESVAYERLALIALGALREVANTLQEHQDRMDEIEKSTS